MALVAILTIDNTRVAADHTDFPVYVNLADMPASFWNTVTNGGGDIRVYKADGVTELPREIVSCLTASDTGEMFFKYSGTLSGSVDTEVQIHADGTSSEPAAGASNGRNAVWSDYRMVTHGGTVDSTGNNTLTKNGTFAETSSNTKVGAGAYNVPSASATASMTLGSVEGRTITMWARRTTGGNNGYLFDLRTGLGNGFLFLNDPDTTLSFGAGITSVYKDASAATSGVTTFTNNTYHHYAAKMASTWIDDIVIGNRNSAAVDADCHAGQLDEIRISKTADLSADWITTEYNNLNSPSTFYSVLGVGGFTPKIMIF